MGRQSGENNLLDERYVITASTVAGRAIVYLAINEEENDPFWTRNISKATIWEGDINTIYLESIGYIEKAIENTREIIIYASIMIHKVEHTLFPIEQVMNMKVVDGMENVTALDLVNSGKSYMGKEIEMWCVKNIKKFATAAKLYNKYFNKELLRESENAFPASSKAYYFVMEVEGEYYLHRDYDKSGPMPKRPVYRKY